MFLRIVAGLFLLFAAGQLPAATFTASASGCGFDFQTSTSGPVQAIVTDKDCTGFGGDIDTAYARSGPTGLGASAEHLHTCCDTATSAGGTAFSSTDFMITGPAGPVMISLNLALTGQLGGGSAADTSVRWIRIDAAIPGLLAAFGQVMEIASDTQFRTIREGALTLPGDLCATVCLVPTTQIQINTGQWYTLELSLIAGAGGGIGDHFGWADARNTLYFPLDGPVFNLPDGYSAEIPDMNVAGNRVVRQEDPGGEVPEPGTCALAGAGLLVVTLLRRRNGAARPKRGQ